MSRIALSDDYDLYHSLQDSDFAARFQKPVMDAFPVTSHPCVLDFGCGRGHALRRFLEDGRDAHGIDCSCVALAHASQHLGIDPKRLRHVDAGRPFPFPEHFFNLVFTADTLEHLQTEDVPYALAELGRVCGGTLVASICFRPSESLAETGIQWHATIRPRRWWNEQLHRFTNLVDVTDPRWETPGEPNLFVLERRS